MRLIPLRQLVLSVAIAAVSTTVAQAQDLRLPALFGDHMVLQRGIEVPVWGWGMPQSNVTVSFGQQKKSTQVGEDGKWMLKLDALSVGGPSSLTVQSAGQTQSFADVLVGEVWVCSGQSNMQWTVAKGIDPDLEAARANRPNLRLFQVPLVSKAEPQDDVVASWRISASGNVSSFSAVAYYFGVNLQETLGVPVGLIQTAWGGTRAEAWTSPEMMANVGELKPILDTWAERVASYDADTAKTRYEAALKKWEETRSGRRPVLQGHPRYDRHHPSNLYNAMIAPLAPYAIQGAIWYQGESNAGRAYQYRTLMPSMIQSWRDTWGQGDFAFYQVQLANYKMIVSDPVESDWAELREAQYMATEALPNVGAACITDIGAANDIHPKNKQDVGKRLARLALADVYDRAGSIVRNGPTYKSMSVDGAKVTLTFDIGLSPLIPYYREALTGFAVAGEDKQWHWATAKITAGNTVVVSSEAVAAPVAVRYNWADNPQGNLFNEHYLPAYPFRTDDWKGVTADSVTP